MNLSTFSLSWDEFHINLREYLKQENDFLNVTLACDGNQQIKAHKVILSPGSLFFRDVLGNSKYPEPFLYLSGIQEGELQIIVDSFLEISRLLQINGVEILILLAARINLVQ